MSELMIKIPLQVTLDLSGTFNVQVLQADDYSLEAANETITGFLPDGILDAFIVTNASGSDVALLDVAMDLSGKELFLEAFKSQLESALVDPDAGGNLESYLRGYANDELLKDLRNNGIAAALEADGLEELEYTNLSSSYDNGALTMWDGLVNLAPKKRSLIATQIPNDAWMAAGNGYDNDGGMLKRALPIKRGGDSLVFQLVVEQQFEVTAEPMENYSYAGQDPAARATPGVGTGRVAGVPYAVPRRIVNMVMTRSIPSANPGIQSASAGVMPTEANTSYKGAFVSVHRTSVADLENPANSSSYVAKQAAAQAAYTTWNAAKTRLQDKVRAETGVSIAEADRDAAQAVLAQATTNLLASPTSEPFIEAAERATVALDKALVDLSVANGVAALSHADTAGSVETVRAAAAAASAAAAAQYNAYINAKKDLAAGLAVLEVALQKHTMSVEKKEYSQESADAAAAEAKGIWESAVSVFNGVKVEAGDLSGELNAAIAADVSANAAMVSAAADAADVNDPDHVSKSATYQLAITAHGEAQVAFEEAKAAYNAKHAELSSAMGNANAKLQTYVKFYYYAGDDAASPVVAPQTVADNLIPASAPYTDRAVSMSPYVAYTAEHSHA